MRNLKRALSLALASVMLMGMMVVGTSAAYNDVDRADNVEAIEVLQEVGIMKGDENGNFNPDALLTRQEMAVVMSNLMDYRVASYKGTCPFADVADWAEPYVAACFTNGITSGMGEGYYGATENVTTAQAALMLMKALGYFQYASDFGADWQLATVKQANKIDLFDGVASGVKEAMTRNDLAQLVLNTLESGMVEADNDVTKVEADDVKVEAGSVKYYFLTSEKDYATTIDDATTLNLAGQSGTIIELGEKLYAGNLKCDPATDDFMRPATAWTYKSSDIGTYADDVDASWTTKVTEKALVKAAGTAAFDNYTWSVYRNSAEIFDGVEGKDVLAYGKNSGERWQNCDNGVLTEMYIDSDEEDQTVTVVIIDQIVAEVTKVVDNGDDYTVTVSFKTGVPAGTEKTFDTETKFAKEDVVIVTVGSGEIQSMAVAETVSGNVDAISENSNITVEGTKYNYNRAYCVNTLLNGAKGLYDLDDGGYVNPALDNDIVLYLDTYGNAVAVEGAEDSVNDYLFIVDTDVAYGDYSAKVVFADGTKAKIDIDEIDDLENGDEGFNTPAKGDIFKFKKSGNAYDLTTVDFEALAAAEIEKGAVAIVDGEESYVANNSTVYVDVDAGKTWTGYKNISSKNGMAGALLVDEDDDVVRVVFFDAEGNSAAEDDDYVFIASTTKTTKYIDDEQIWEYTGYVNGEKKTIVATADDIFTTKGLYLVKTYSTTNDAWVDDADLMVDALDNDIFTTNAANYAKQGVLALDAASSNLTDGSQTSFSYDDATLFVTVELKNSNATKTLGSDVDTVSVGAISDIDVEGEGKTAVYVLTVEDDSDATPLAEMVLVIVPDDEYVAPAEEI